MGNNSNDATGNNDNEKSSRDDEGDRFGKFGKSTDSSRGRRPAPYGRGRRQSPPPRDKSFGDRGRDFPFPRDEPGLPGRDRSPMRGGFDDRFGDRFKKDDLAFPRREELGRKDLPRPSYFDDPYRDKYPSLDTRVSRYDPPGGFNSRFDLPPDDPYNARPYNYPGSQYKDYYRPEGGYPKPNECEIIVVNKAQRPYAETVEARMKNLGIQVDILFLKDEALLVQTIDDIARRGSLYAMVISPQNEVHGSVTLNILYGTPQEHRNMPLDDALKLVARNFHDYLRNQREAMDRDRSERGPYQGALPADKEMQFLLRVLADGRSITLSEIESVIRYLQERRDKLKSPQGDRGPPGGLPDVIDPAVGPLKDESSTVQKQQDLQHRIMSLINKGGPPPSSTGVETSVGGMSSSIPSQAPIEADAPGMGPSGADRNKPGMGSNLPAMGGRDMGMGSNSSGMGPNQQNMRPNQPGMGYNAPSSSPSTYINFDNPSVQKALDNLMQSGGPNLLKNISMSGSNTGGDQNMPGSNQMKQPSMGGMNPQGGGPGSMSGQFGGMGSGMGPHQNNMGPPSGHGMGPNMGPGPMSGMGSGPNPYTGPGMYGMGPNMMGGSMPPRHHMMGGPGGNPGSMLGGMGGGGPRRY